MASEQREWGQREGNVATQKKSIAGQANSKVKGEKEYSSKRE